MSVIQMGDNLHNYAKRHVNKVCESDIPDWRKHDIMTKVGAMLNDGNYQNMTLYELRELARQRGISRFSHTRKDVLIKALENGCTEIPRKLDEPSERFNVEAERLGREMLRKKYESSRQGSRDKVGAYRSREFSSRERVGGSRGRVGCGC